MERFDSLSDEQLHGLAISGDRIAEEELVSRCSRLVRSVARRYFLVGGENEDLLQEGFIGLLSAISEYKEDLNSSFRSYAEICIRRRILSAIKAATRKKHAPLNEGVSLEEALEGDNSHSHVVSDFSSSPEEQVLAKEKAEELIRSISQSLSFFEQRVLTYFLDGYSYHDIADLLGKSDKSVDNAVQRIRRKLDRTHSVSDNSES